jgi:hypothetical protein
MLLRHSVRVAVRPSLLRQYTTRETPWNIPNALTVARIGACPFLGYAIVHGQYELATGVLLAGGFSDWASHWMTQLTAARRAFGAQVESIHCARLHPRSCCGQGVDDDPGRDIGILWVTAK